MYLHTVLQSIEVQSIPEDASTCGCETSASSTPTPQNFELNQCQLLIGKEWLRMPLLKAASNVHLGGSYSKLFLVDRFEYKDT